MFYRINVKSHGIGLVTVKKIAEQTGLGFIIRSEPEKYTEVTIKLANAVSIEKAFG